MQIYARLTGYGQSGTLASAAGHDMNYVAVTGLLSRFVRTGDRPLPPVNLLADFAGGSVMCVLGVLIALLERQTSGKGQVIDAAMTDGAAYLSSFIYETLDRGTIWPNANKPGSNLLDSGSPLYDVYETSVKGEHLAVAPLEPKFHVKLFEMLELDPGESITMAFQQPDVLRAQLASIFKRKTRAQWETMFAGVDVCITPVYSINEAVNHPHNKARGTFTQDHRGMMVPRPAPRLERTPACPDFTTGVHRTGVDTRNVLQNAGYTLQEIDKFVNDGVVVQAETTNAKM